MIPVNARQQGGAVIMTIPADLVKLLNIKSGDPMSIDVVPGGFITRPVSAVSPQRYTLSELLKGVDPKAMNTLNAETSWAREGVPVGRELA